ncbi:hypothetical protein OPT61_g10757 [Boeremia exigua]|uniref:Uncharacterized protein n=1 Tax=Boeremia exigua TaxID=749465 RepID=A0ACC2HN06_9PLEO|nr:hypothetical protein OPT61_g10757 [Boeremia exigua]
MASYAADVSQGAGQYAATQSIQDFDAAGMGYEGFSIGQNTVQDWFSGSRYLMNFMDSGTDIQMPDLNNGGF